MLSNKNLLIWLVAVFFLAGCSKNLDQTPQSTANKDVVFGSEDGLALYANSFYDILPGINDVFRKDGDMSDYGARNSVPDYIRTGYYNPRQSTGWTWTNLRNLNYFIANNTGAGVSQTVRDNYTALARFFRAYFYYGMIQRFGDVPWISKPLTVTDSAILYAGRDPRAKVMDSVLADLNYAIGHLTLAADPSRSRITKWVAYGMKSRICLFEGTYRKYDSVAQQTLSSTANQWLQEAASAAKAVIDSGGFSLNTANGTDLSYRNLFISASPVTSEIMLANVTSPTLSVLNDANWWYTSTTYGVRLNFTRDFINMYLNIDGTPFTDIPGHDTLAFWEETKNRDKRLQQTIRTPGYTRISSGSVIAAPPTFTYSYTGYQPIKWCLDDTYYDGATLNTNSISLMRYAEILLNYAEAQNEATGPNADILNALNLIRVRAGMPPLQTADATGAGYVENTKEAFRARIRNERAVELAFEDFRWYDIMRWKAGPAIVAQPMYGMETTKNANGTFTYKKVLLPQTLHWLLHRAEQKLD